MKDGPYAFCETFAVLVNPTEEDVHELLETVDFDVLQFHGEETVSFIKDIQKKNRETRRKSTSSRSEYTRFNECICAYS